METAFPLEGLFFYLVHDRSFPLTVRDYKDALRALRLGFGGGSREDLFRLLETLWTRTEEEARQLNLAFRSLPSPTADEIAAWTGRRPSEGAVELGHSGRESEKPGGKSKRRIPVIEFAAPGQQGLALPQAQVILSGHEPFVLQSRPPVGLRSIIMTWRRFRQTVQTGPRLELDLPATITEKARYGVVVEPVLAPTRRNLARLIILVDTSPAMTAWRGLNGALAESLLYSRLGLGALYFFHEVPGDLLYERENLTGPILLTSLLKQHGPSTLLVFSDAGSAKDKNDREQRGEIIDFLKRVQSIWQPIAWVNPFARRRWKGTPAEDIERFPNLVMCELTEDGLVQAIDFLRENRG